MSLLRFFWVGSGDQVDTRWRQCVASARNSQQVQILVAAVLCMCWTAAVCIIHLKIKFYSDISRDAVSLETRMGPVRAPNRFAARSAVWDTVDASIAVHWSRCENSRNIPLHFLPLLVIYTYARLAQSVERGTFNPEVKGSSPLSGVVLFRGKNK